MNHDAHATPDATPRQMLLGGQVMLYGSAEAAWRWPAAADAYTQLAPMVEAAQWAERGKMQFLFMADHPAMRGDLTHRSPTATLDPIVVASNLITRTSHIGVVLTQSTTFNFPYTVARQLKAMDLLSGGRIGWNAVTTNDPQIAANYGTGIDERDRRYARAHEFIQLVQALWGSFGEDALTLDKQGGTYARGEDIRAVNLGGQFVASRGPLPIPPSPQGQPILFQAGGGNEALGLAGAYASGVYSMAADLQSGREHRAALDAAARTAGRRPEDIRLFMGLATTVADTYDQALARRDELMQFVADTIPSKLAHLSALVGVPLAERDLHTALSPDLASSLHPAPFQLHSNRAARLLAEGMTPYEVLLHGVTDFHTTLIGSPEDIADQMQELFTAGAADGFVIVPDVMADGLPAFVERVVPLLQDRDIFHRDYDTSTLRGHFGAPPQYGRRG